MHRIDGPGAVNNKFTEGDPAVPQMATVVTANWLNDMQENICRVLEAVGITPVKGDYEQLRLAIALLSGSGLVGEIRLWGSPNLPSNGDWLECDGSPLLIVDYPALYAVYGGIFGTAPTGHFRLPDIRGRAVRGYDHGAGRDEDAATRVFGSTQEDAIKIHDHPVGVNGNYAGGGAPSIDYGNYLLGTIRCYTQTIRWKTDNSITPSEMTTYNMPLAAETRMKNIALMHIVRWR